MTINRRGFTILAGVLVVVIVGGWMLFHKNGSNGVVKDINPIRGDIQLTISAVGTVKPQNRLQIKPPINGRIEKVLVDEGDVVKVGQMLALMSSTERATLIDAARIKGDEEYVYWQKVYKETPLIAPIDGVVIVRAVEPGQTITPAEAVLVLSDRLIVEADVDETDIGEVKVGQKASVTLDAYPEIKIDATVDHISYESEVLNNVTTYKADILPVKVPEVFRSGMSANVDIIVAEANDALLIPEKAVSFVDGHAFVMAKKNGKGDAKSVEVTTGIKNDNYIEIKTGLGDKDIVLLSQVAYKAASGKTNGTNPFMPQFKGKK